MTAEQSKNEYINLKEKDEKAFREQMKQGIFKELFRRELLTRAQLSQLLDIA